MADLYTKRGLVNKASPLLQEIIRARERVQGPEHPDVASALNNLAELLRSQVGHESCSVRRCANTV